MGTISTDLISYIPPLSSLEFITTEVEKAIARGYISIDRSRADRCLRIADRPPEINARISAVFEKLTADTTSRWGLYNGAAQYCIGRVEEHKLIGRMIRESPERKDFYALDIGAGNYNWGEALADYLEKMKLPEGVTVHIIGIRGEKNLNAPVREMGRCRLYEFGEFQIERLSEEFERRDLLLANKVDLVVSRWTFRHLVDPVGTFVQAFDLVRPETGFMLFDGFIFLDRNQSCDENERVASLCRETNSEALMYFFNVTRSLNHFILRKQDSAPCEIFKKYRGIVDVDPWSFQIGSATITEFTSPKKETPHLPEIRGPSFRYVGNESLFKFLEENDLFV